MSLPGSACADMVGQGRWVTLSLASQLHSVPQRRSLSANTESNWRCRMEWGWLARLEIPNVDMSINYVIDKSESAK